MINSKVEKIISSARDKYAVHECRECTYRKCCELGFGSAECLSRRVSISLMLGIEDSYFTKLLDDIEAAAKQVVVSKTETATVGNAAALREALVAVKKSIDGIGESSLDCDPTILLAALTQVCARLSARIERALSAPARECDVGIAEEQAERFGKFCGKYYNEEGPCNEECPLASLPIIHGFPRCQAYWAQTPYEAQEGAGE